MADYDRRGGYQNNRKRRFRDDDNDPRAFQRHRPDIPIPIRIRRQLLALADSPLRDWHEDVLAVARLVAEHSGADGDEGDRDRDNAYVRDQFVAFVAGGPLVLEQPLKIPFVAAVLQVLNTIKPTIVLDVLRTAAAATETAIAEGRWRDVKLRLRLLACLQPCLEGDSGSSDGGGVFSLLDTLFARAGDLQTASSDDVVGTELVKIILLTIPYIMASTSSSASQPNYAQWQQRAADLMEKTDVIASEPHALQSLLDPYLHGGAPDADDGADDGDAPPPTESMISLLQKQLQAEAANGWPLACLPRPWKLPLEEVELQAKLDDQPTKHVLPAIAVPETVVAGPQPLFPEVYFSVYGAWANAAEAADTTDAASAVVHSVPPLNHVASTLVRDVLVDTVNGLDFNRNVTARYLIDVDCYFAENTFVKRATPFDRLRDVDPSRSTWKPEDVAVDTVFAQLFQLPASEHKLVYYHAVLAEACKLAPSAIAPSLGRAIRFLYRNSPRMDLELVGRFVDWFAHHVSNFGFTWKWDEWVDDVALPDLHPHKAFILGAIEKEIRLSFAQRIKNTLPAPYQALIQRETELDVPPFKYREVPDGEDGASVPFAAEGRELAALLKRKAPDEEVQAVIERIHSQVLDENASAGGEEQPHHRRRVDPLVASTDAFTTAVLWVGAKSLSHVLACIERTKERFFDAGAASEAACTQILASVMAFWSAHPGIAVSIAEKLLNYEILTPAAVVQWALQQPLEEKERAREEELDGSGGNGYGKVLATTHVSELVFHTVDKVTRRVHQLVAASQAADAVVAAARKTLQEAQERQKNPPLTEPAAKPEQQQADILDIAMDEGSASDAAVAAVARAAAVVEAAETELAQAEAAVESTRAAEAKESTTMRELFGQLQTALEPWLAAESAANGNSDQQTDQLVKAWAVRWQRVVQRSAAMEEAFLSEVARGRAVVDVNGSSSGMAASSLA